MHVYHCSPALRSLPARASLFQPTPYRVKRRYARLLWSLLALALLRSPALISAHAAPVTIASSAPTLSAQVLDETSTSVTFKFPKILRARFAVILVDRKRGTTKLPTYRFKLQSKVSAFTFFDRDLPPGTYSYRGRVRIGKRISHWSSTRKIKILDPNLFEGTPTPGPTPAPTISPTPLPKPVLPHNFTECANAAARITALNEVNLHRASDGQAPLVENEKLYFAALAHSIFMASLGQLTHQGWEEEFDLYGVTGSTIGQNIASSFQSPHDVVVAWMESESHRTNILKSGFSRMGIACVADANGKPWWTQNFSGG